MTIRRLASLLVLVAVSACGSSPVAPAPTPAASVTFITYTINIPSSTVAFTLRQTYPDGIRLSPLDAQRQYDYTAMYGGSPNVYFGETAPACEYVNTGIVVAPRIVAGMSTFTALDWPGIGLDAGKTYGWLGRFAFTELPAAGTFVYDPANKCATPK